MQSLIYVVVVHDLGSIKKYKTEGITMGFDTLKDLNTILKRAFSEASAATALYTQGELNRVQETLSELGYSLEADGAYPDEESFRVVLSDYMKVDQDNKPIGVVTLHLDKGNKTGMVADGTITIDYDRELQAKAGRITTVSDFAATMKPSPVQKLAQKIFSIK
jgi:hypothetical protein